MDLSELPQDPRNPITVEKVRLGQVLFHETAMGVLNQVERGRETYSCASCHHSRAGFQSGIRQSIGEGGNGFGENGEMRVADFNYDVAQLDVQPIRALSILNAAYHEVAMWDGSLGSGGPNEGTEAVWPESGPAAANRLGYAGIETQAIAWMTVHRLDAESSRIRNHVDYRGLFAAAFPEEPDENRITNHNAALAIAAFERTIVAREAPFQQWLRGRTWTMSEQETEGALLFFGKAGCDRCHRGPSLSSDTFAALGMENLRGEGVVRPPEPGDPASLGRGSFTRRDEDLYRFKTPQLYNLADAGYFGHGGSFTAIRDVVEYKNLAIPANPDVNPERLDPRFVPLGLSDAEVDAISAFLTDALRDPSLDRYDPAYLPSRNCFPNNDQLSRLDLRCF
jgi:cytochrome c peroxidase